MATIVLDSYATYAYDLYSFVPAMGISVSFWPADIGLESFGPRTYYGTLGSPADHPNNVFTDANDMISYYTSTGLTDVCNSVTNSQSINTYTPGVLQYAGTSTSYASPSRSLNSTYQNNNYRNLFVTSTVDIACSLSLTGGQTGTVVLEYADDSGFTTNTKTIQSTVNGNTGTLTIGLAITQTSSASLTGMVPPQKYYRWRTVNNTGTPTFTFRSAQEVLF